MYNNQIRARNEIIGKVYSKTKQYMAKKKSFSPGTECANGLTRESVYITK